MTATVANVEMVNSFRRSAVIAVPRQAVQCAVAGHAQFCAKVSSGNTRIWLLAVTAWCSLVWSSHLLHDNAACEAAAQTVAKRQRTVGCRLIESGIECFVET